MSGADSHTDFEYGGRALRDQTGRDPLQRLYGKGAAAMSVHQSGGYGETGRGKDRYQGRPGNARLSLIHIEED